MTPIVPFEPGRTPAGHVRASLRDAYSDDAIRSFVDKLRQLAVLSPRTCGAVLRVLDQVLAGWLDDIATLGVVSRPRGRQLSDRGLEFFKAIDNLTTEQFDRMTEQLERASSKDGGR